MLGKMYPIKKLQGKQQCGDFIARIVVCFHYIEHLRGAVRLPHVYGNLIYLLYFEKG